MSREEPRQQAVNQLDLAVMLEEIGSVVHGVVIDAEISGRVKRVSSVLNKVAEAQTDVAAALVLDLFGIRIIVNNNQQCYRIIDLIHLRFRHLGTEYDDYIKAPKKNGYRSLHTTIFAPDGRLVEIQVRTREMHACAERGSAAHWRYKQLQESDPSNEHTTDARK